MALFENAFKAARAVRTVHQKDRFSPSLRATVNKRNQLYQEFKKTGLPEGIAQNFLQRAMPVRGKAVPKAAQRTEQVSFNKGRFVPRPKLPKFRISHG
jgi:hypothetical protein